MTKRLDGTVALVTGASSGIGEAAGLGLFERRASSPIWGDLGYR
jgi:NAD(P)-dependent dehydrogenase (short-subunit alcohol dehydrogenase family)